MVDNQLLLYYRVSNVNAGFNLLTLRSSSPPPSLPSTPSLSLCISLLRSRICRFYLIYKIPGSNVIARYVKSSHQNDPDRTDLEIY